MRRWLLRIGLGLLLVAASLAGAVGLARSGLAAAGSTARSRWRASARRSTVVRDAQAIPHVDGAERGRRLPRLGLPARPGPALADGVRPPGRPGPAGGGRWARRRCPIDRFMRTLGPAGAPRPRSRSSTRGPGACSRPTPPASTPRSPATAWPLPPEFLILRHRPEPWRPADSLRVPEADGARPRHATGARSCCAPASPSG